MTIHKTAIIDETAKIAPDVEIGAYTIIGKDVVIESGCTIGESANIQYAKIGKIPLKIWTKLVKYVIIIVYCF